ncbi:hypothetical protein ES702_00182 [subsurface metagenome]
MGGKVHVRLHMYLGRLGLCGNVDGGVVWCGVSCGRVEIVDGLSVTVGWHVSVCGFGLVE